MKMRVSSVGASHYCALSLIPVLLVAAAVGGQENRPHNQAVAPLTAVASNSGSRVSDERKAQIGEAYGKLPLAFEKNQGQSDSQVQYLSHGNGYDLFLTPQEAVLALREASPRPSSLLHRRTATAPTAGTSQKSSVLRMEFDGANRYAAISGLQRLPGKIDYFTGNDPQKWHTDVPSYSRVEYRDMYPGIDAVFYGNQHRLEYDFVVAPGSDPRAIALSIEGTPNLHIEPSGVLAIGLSNGEVHLEKPIVYQTIGGERREVAGNYAVSGRNRVTFEVPQFDHTLPLVIDPVLDYSTYLGGSAVGDFGSAIAVDSSGNAYVAGTTYSTSFPTVSNITAAGAGTSTSGAAFVTELNAAGTQEVYSSYLSGDTGEFGQGLALDTLGNIYVCGETLSTNYPTTLSGFSQTATPIANPNGTAFLSKINPAGSGSSALLYSSLLGGTNGDFALAVTADASGNAYVTGFTNSMPGAAPTLFTLQGAYQTTLKSADGNAFLIRIDTTKSGAASLIYSTYLGGSGMGNVTNISYGEEGFGVAVDAVNNAYLVGTTSSSDFPTTSNAYLQAPLVPSGPSNISNGGVFVSKINTAASGNASLVYSSYLYGTNLLGDFGNAIALGPSNVAYITGQTFSSFYVTSGAYSVTPGGTSLIFVSLIDTSKSGSSSVPYSALIGGSLGDDFGTGIRADALGNAYVTGSAGSVGFPVTPGALQSIRPGTNGNAFALELNPGGHGFSDLLYASYFGDTTGAVFGTSLALDTLKNVYITGYTAGTDFPVFPTGSPSAFQTSLTGSDGGATQAAFVSKLTLESALAFASPCAFNFSVTPTGSCSLAFGNQLINTPSTTQTITLTNNTGSSIALTLPLTVSGANASDFAAAPAPAGGTGACTATLAAAASCAIGVTYTPSVGGPESATVTVGYTYNNGLSATAPGLQTVSVTGTGLAPTATLNPTTTLNFPTPQPIATTSSALPVTVSNTGTGNLSFTAAPALSGANAGDFAIASGTTCANGGTLAPTATCTINITFTPTALGARTATLTITDNASNSPQTITITGTAVAAAPVATVTPLTVPFGNQLVTTTSGIQSVTVKNTGNVNLNITAAPSFSGTNASDFAIASGTTCTNGASVTPNSTCVINVTFTPPANGTGSRTAALNIADNAAGSPQTVTLTGAGTVAPSAATVSPSTLTFTVQFVTTASAAQAVTVKNTGGSNLTISATPTFAGANASDFAAGTGTTCTNGASVTPNSTCVINVTFTPPAGASGSRTATLSIADSATGSPQTVALSGTAGDFTVSAPSATINAGSTATIAVTVGSLGGFTGAVTLSCSGTIPQGSCSAPSSAVTAPGTANVMVTTHGSLTPPTSTKRPPISMQQVALAVLALMLLLILPTTRRFRTRLGLAGAAALLVVVAGCAGNLRTPSGTYPVTITGTSGSVTHAVVVNVVVN